MFASSFIKEVKTLSGLESIGLYESIDTLNTFVTPILLGICVAIVGTSTFYLRGMDCFVSDAGSGSGLSDYIQDYCWVHGTIPIQTGQTLPTSDIEWNTRDATSRIVYYQWMPFFLGLMAVLFYLPHYFWSAVCHNRVGTDYAMIVSLALKALHAKDTKSMDETMQKAADGLYDMLCFTRRVRNFEKAYLKSSSLCRRLLFHLHHALFFNKSINRALVIAYFFFKCMLLTLAVVELWLFARFLNYDGNFLQMGVTLARYLLSGRQWEETMWFPRVAYCRVNLKMFGSEKNHYVAQCSLNINMINEKLCIFLLLWFLALSVINALNLLVWLFRFSFRSTRFNFVNDLLRKADKLGFQDAVEDKGEEKKPARYPVSDSSVQKHVENFACTFLKQDGVFVLRMVLNNVGTFMCSRLLSKLWIKYMDSKDSNGLPDAFGDGLPYEHENEYI